VLAAYLAALGFGLTILLASLAFGGKELDHGHGGVHTGEGHAAEHALDKGDAFRLGPHAAHLLSIRFWTFGLASFGATGTLTTLLGAEGIVSLLASTVTGLAIGLLASLFFRSLQRDSVSGETSLREFVGDEARVLVPIRPGGRGTIAIRRQSGNLELVATTQDAEPIPAGAEVLVASVQDGVADVTLSRPTDEVARRARLAAKLGQQA
jgi:hypothetical protein